MLRSFFHRGMDNRNCICCRTHPRLLPAIKNLSTPSTLLYVPLPVCPTTPDALCRLCQFHAPPSVYKAFFLSSPARARPSNTKPNNINASSSSLLLLLSSSSSS